MAGGNGAKNSEKYCRLWRNFSLIFLFLSVCLPYIRITFIVGRWHTYTIYLNSVFVSFPSPKKLKNTWLTESPFHDLICMPQWSRSSAGASGSHCKYHAHYMSTRTLHSPHPENNKCFSLCFQLCMSISDWQNLKQPCRHIVFTILTLITQART